MWKIAMATIKLSSRPQYLNQILDAKILFKKTTPPNLTTAILKTKHFYLSDVSLKDRKQYI